MATITGLTSERMQEIVDKTLVGASIVSNELILELEDGSTIDAGSVVATTPPVVTTKAALAALETFNGREAYYEFDSANGKRWHLVYDLPNDRWTVVGGPPLLTNANSDVGSPGTGTAYGVTGSMTVTCPLAGSYMVQIGGDARQTNGSGLPIVGYQSYQVGATAPSDADAAMSYHTVVNIIQTVVSPIREKVVASGTVIDEARKDNNASFGITLSNRFLYAMPTYVTTA